MALTLLTMAASLAGLAWFADQFVVGAAGVATIRRISPLLIGVVVIGFGTSSPELLVSSLAAIGGEPEIAVGNIVGSNLANLSLLLGIGALISPLVVGSAVVRREATLALAAMILFAVLVQGGIGVLEGVVLLAGLAGALTLIARGTSADGPAEPPGEGLDLPERGLTFEVGRTLLGLVGTIASAQLLLWAATTLARDAGLSDAFVGVTLVAVGTSLPELVTVVQSARRRETALIVGNLLGSNLFNALGVGGVVGVLDAGSIDAPEVTLVAVSAAIVVTGLALIAMRSGHTVTRGEGALLVVGYAALVPVLL